MSNPGGKGSTQRPFSVSQEQYASRWDAIFGKDLSTSEKRAEESTEIMQDSAEIRRVFEGDDENHQKPLALLPSVRGITSASFRKPLPL
jgi:hypothetical protein